jgi:DNA-binding XRE family transcriptional regulator
VCLKYHDGVSSTGANEMAKKKKIPDKLKIWIDARKRFHLSHEQIQMARELGMNPKKFGKLENHKQEPWKAPLPDLIKSLYYKRFRKEHPDQVKSIERIFKNRNMKKEEKKLRKKLEMENPIT